MTNTTKHKKHSIEWNKNIKQYVGKEIDHIYKKGEKKLDDFEFKGVEITEDIKTEKVNEIELLIAQIKEREKLVETKKDEVNKASGYDKKYAELSIEYGELKTRVAHWKANLNASSPGIGTTASTNFVNQSKSLRQGGTDTYRGTGEGWNKLQADYTKKTFTPTGGSATEYNNLYDGNLWTGDSATSKDIKITEQEAIKWLTYTIKHLSKEHIDKAEFEKHIGIGGSVPTGITLDYHKIGERSTTTATGTKTAVSGWLKTIQDHADGLVETTNEQTGRKEYQFGHGYWKDIDDQSQGLKDPKIFDKHSLQAFLELLNFFSYNDKWLNHADVKTKVLKNVAEENEMTFIPADNTPWTEKQLHDLGHEAYLNNSYAKSTKATGFYKDIKLSEWADKAIKFNITEGLKGWSSILLHFIDAYDNTSIKGKIEKLKDSLGDDTSTPKKNTPLNVLLEDLNTSYDAETTSFQNNGNNYTMEHFPKYFHDKQTRYHGLKGEKKALLTSLEKGGDELLKKETELEEAKTGLKTKQTELDAKITEKKNELLKTLETDWKTDASKVNDLKGANKINAMDLNTIQYLLTKITYLETFDEEGTSTALNGNVETLKTNIKNLKDKTVGAQSFSDTDIDKRKIACWNTFIRNIPERKYDKGIEETKKLVDNGMFSWNDVVEGFDKLDELIKTNLWEKEAQTAVKNYMNKDNNNEKLTDWQSKLKLLDPLLTADVVSDARFQEFKKIDNFKTIANVEGLIKKVLDKDTADDTKWKVKDGFIQLLKKEDADVSNLANMFAKFSAEKIIKLIALFDYEKNKTDEDKKKIRRVYSWSESLKVDDKFVDDEEDYPEDKITDEEKKSEGKFTKFLYQVATGEKSLTMTKPTETGDEDNGNENQPNKEGGFWNHLSSNWYWYLGGFIVIVGGLAFFFWASIKEWWSEKPEEEAVEKEKEEDEE